MNCFAAFIAGSASQTAFARQTLLVCAVLLAGGIFAAGVEAQSSGKIEGAVDAIRAGPDQRLELSVVSGTNSVSLAVEDAGGNAPALSSRIRAASKSSWGQNGAPELTVTGLDQIQFLSGFPLPLATHIAGLHRLGGRGQHIQCVAELQGLVLAASTGREVLALQDASGLALLEIPAPSQLARPGQEISLQGNCLVESDRVLFRDPPVVDNNDVHTMREEWGRIYLSAGRHPLRLAWFNQEFPYGLEVYFQGPGLPRQKIPDSALFRKETDPTLGTEQWVNGLNYVCAEGDWLRVPDFDRLPAVKRGTVANFDTSVATRVNDVGLQFSGWVAAPNDCIYTFSTISDDGSLLFIDEKPTTIAVTGTHALPAPAAITVRQSLPANPPGAGSFGAAPFPMLPPSIRSSLMGLKRKGAKIKAPAHTESRRRR